MEGGEEEEDDDDDEGRRKRGSSVRSFDTLHLEGFFFFFFVSGRLWKPDSATMTHKEEA